jgi:membrane protein implicated in regulation of membrane protease activity
MPWWGWVVAGAALLATEIVVPFDFWLVFIGLAAVVTGFVAYLAPGLSDTSEWALFGGFAVVSLVFFRRLVRRRFVERRSDSRLDDSLVGEVGTTLEGLAPGAFGRVELRGTTWKARNTEGGPLEVGARVRVERVEGLLLHVRRAA